MSGRCRKGRGIRKAQSSFVHVQVQVVGIHDVCSLARGLSIAIHGPVARLLHHLCLPTSAAVSDFASPGAFAREFVSEG